MISQEVFESTMSEVLLLLGATMKREAINVMHDRLKDHFVNADLKSAVDDILSPEREIHKLTYPVLLKALNTRRSIRLEREAGEQKQREAEQAADFWQADYHTTRECSDHKCTTCKYLPIRCDTIAKHTMDAIKMMLHRPVRPKEDGEAWTEYHQSVREENRQYCRNILDALSRQFPHIGFEKDIDDKFTGRYERHYDKYQTPKPRRDIDFLEEE